MSVDYRITGKGAADIARSVEEALAAGALEPGQLLPPMRALADQLGVNPNTVAAAYRALRERGVVETAGRRGTRIRPRPASVARESIRVEVPAGVRDVSRGNPDPSLLPSLSEAYAASAQEADDRPVLYGHAPLEPGLAAVAERLFVTDGVPTEGLLVTSGSLDAIERVLGAHLVPGDVVAVEDPGWGSLLDLVPALGLRIAPVAVDDEGPVPTAMSEALRSGARAVIVTCRAQNPTGAAVSEGRARELRRLLADSPGVLVIEDDHGHGITSEPPRPLAGATRHWAFVRSAAKACGPDLRLAVTTGDRLTLDRVGGRQRLGPGWVSHIQQRVLARLWAEGAEREARAAAAYGELRQGLLDALRDRAVRAHGAGGMNVWVPVPDETTVISRLVSSGWVVAPGARFRVASGPGVRITVSGLTPRELAPLADAVAAAVRPQPGVRWG